MTLGYSMQFCGSCAAETNHRILESNGKTKKECVACHEQIPYLRSAAKLNRPSFRRDADNQKQAA